MTKFIKIEPAQEERRGEYWHAVSAVAEAGVALISEGKWGNH